MSLQFCKLIFPVEARSLQDAYGNHLPVYPLQYGSLLEQWADPTRSVGWIREANRLLRDNARIASLDAPVNRQDRTANANQANAQYQYVREIVTAIAHVYNLLNLVWWNDPDARRLYRQYIAGPPAIENIGSTNTPNRSVFEQIPDYNPNWYTKDYSFPTANYLSNGWGQLQSNALRQADHAGAKPGTRFAISALILMAPTTALNPGQAVEMASAVYNTPMVRMKYAQSCSFPLSAADSSVGSGGNFSGFGGRLGSVAQQAATQPATLVSFPWDLQCQETSTSYTAYSSDGYGNSPHAIMPDGTELPKGFDDWRAAYYGPMYNGWTGTVVTAPLRDYLVWLQAWAASLAARTLPQIIQDTRAFTVYQNSMTIKYNGTTVQQAIASIVNTNADIEAQKHARSAEATVTSGFLLGAAGVASSVPGAGTVAAVILGAAAAVVSVVDMLITKGTKGHGRDDLGRYKLQLERAWLSGDPTALDAQTGAPILPSSEAVDPPGKGTAWFELATINGNLSCPTYPRVPGGSASMHWAWIVVTTAIAGGVGYWYFKRKKR